MVSEFHFADFLPGDDLRAKANGVLDQILDLAPYGSVAVALLKKEGDSFRCSVDVYSKLGPFIASAIQPTPMEAVRHVQNALGQNLRVWKERRQVLGPGRPVRAEVLTAQERSPFSSA